MIITVYNFSHPLLNRSKIYSRKDNTTYMRAPDAIDITPDGGIVVVIDSKNRNLKTFVYNVWCRATYHFQSPEQGPKALAVLINNEVVVSVYSKIKPPTDLIFLDISGKEITCTETIPIEGLTIWYNCVTCRQDLSRLMRKPTICICENQQSAYEKTKAQISFAVTAKLISAFVFATRIVQLLFFLNLKFLVSSHLLC